jgi:hypothetical protein
MTETFRKISNIKFNGRQLYYKTQYNSILTVATEFTAASNILYFYKKDENQTPSALGHFKGMSKRSSNCRSFDVDFDVFEFENDVIFCHQKQKILCMELPYEGENMTMMEGMLYENKEVYYEND